MQGVGLEIFPSEGAIPPSRGLRFASSIIKNPLACCSSWRKLFRSRLSLCLGRWGGSLNRTRATDRVL